MIQTPPLDKSKQPRYYLMAFLLPMVVYMLLGSLEPTPPAMPLAIEPGLDAEGPGAAEDDFDIPPEPNWLGLAIPGKYYPLAYAAKFVLTAAVLLWFWPAYREFPWRVNPLAIGVGVVGVALWVGLASLGVEQRLFDWLGPNNWLTSLLGGGGGRAAYNPLGALKDQPALAYGFLALRFLGLAVLVPIVEEAFVRAFLMRYVMHDNWTEIPFGVVNRTAVAVGILLPVLYHPEMLAALVWFSLVTWLMVHTKNFWDCVVAHATTNLLLGIYVVTTGTWELW